jgi:hypothetical protein
MHTVQYSFPGCPSNGAGHALHSVGLPFGALPAGQSTHALLIATVPHAQALQAACPGSETLPAAHGVQVAPCVACPGGHVHITWSGVVWPAGHGVHVTWSVVISPVGHAAHVALSVVIWPAGQASQLPSSSPI